jgi:hypothetical protein
VDSSRSRLAMESYGAPAKLAAPLGMLLGLVELCVGVALAPLPADWQLPALLGVTTICLIRPAAPRRHPRVAQQRVRQQLVA